MVSHEALMRRAIAEAELARGKTGDNPWVGCVIADDGGEILASGHTQGPGENHAEIVAMHAVRALGVDLARTTLYSTLEPCSFHGRTPACSRAIVTAGVRRVITGIRDPNPRVDGLGVQILREGGAQVIEDVCASEVARQLCDWIFEHHPHEPLRRARALRQALGAAERAAAALCDYYGIDRQRADELVARANRA